MDDSISRAAAIDALDGEITITGKINAEAVREYVNAVKGRIERIPSIQPKRGRWEEKEVYDGKAIAEWQSARCSVCGKYHTTPYTYCFSEYNFCPNCGAQMERGGEDAIH